MVKSDDRRRTLGLVLSGGGARGAYQAGVLSGLYQIAEKEGLRQPFQILTGVSAGAINVAFLASCADDALSATKRLSDVWCNIRSDDVFRTDLSGLSAMGWEWIYDIVTGHAHDRAVPISLLNTAPLAALLDAKINFSRIAGNLRRGNIDSVAVSAINYATSEVNIFFQSRRPVDPWIRSERVSREVELTGKHVMASSAIPLFFPPISVNNSFFGDGSLRNLAPLSAALHLGADRLIAVGVRSGDLANGRRSNVWSRDAGLRSTPSIARILSVLLNGVMMDATTIDLERLRRINHTLSLLTPSRLEESDLRPVPHLYIHPSHDLGRIAEEEEESLPKAIRFLLRGLGPVEEGADLLSYLIFEPAYCKRLVSLGYEDTMSRSEEIAGFMLD